MAKLTFEQLVEKLSRPGRRLRVFERVLDQLFEKGPKHAPSGGASVGGKKYKPGQFVPSGTSGQTATKPAKKKSTKPATGKGKTAAKPAAKPRRTQATEGKLVAAKVTKEGIKLPVGREVPAHLKKLRIPPAWKNVRVNLDPEASVIATGFDAKGRKQSVYSDSHHMRQAAAKFKRISNLKRDFDKLKERNKKHMQAGNEAAAALAVIMATGIRPGSTRDTKADVQAYGATTLQSKHVKVNEDGTVTLNFVGKKGVEQSIHIADLELSKIIKQRKSDLPDTRLFNTTYEELLDHTRRVSGGKYKPKDFRTLLASTEAGKMVANMDCCQTEKDYKKAVREVAKMVSSKLGNTPTVALQSYIDPTVFSRLRPAA